MFIIQKCRPVACTIVEIYVDVFRGVWAVVGNCEVIHSDLPHSVYLLCTSNCSVLSSGNVTLYAYLSDAIVGLPWTYNVLFVLYVLM